MKVQYCSDLHLEFQENLRFVQALPFEVSGDVLVIAGDIAYLNDLSMPNIRFWKWATKQYRQVLMVPGNHEFYNNGDIAAHGDSWERLFHPNVGYYQNKVVHIDDTDFILSTLWSRIPPLDEFTVRRGMNDYRQILYRKHRLHPQNINDEFEKSLVFIQKAVDTSKAEKIVVITHHLPTFAAIEDRYKGDALNVAFATELGDYIVHSRINAWIYGHAHHRTDFYIGHTHLVSNPLGYLRAGEGAEFDTSAILNL